MKHITEHQIMVALIVAVLGMFVLIIYLDHIQTMTKIKMECVTKVRGGS